MAAACGTIWIDKRKRHSFPLRWRISQRRQANWLFVRGHILLFKIVFFFRTKRIWYFLFSSPLCGLFLSFSVILHPHRQRTRSILWNMVPFLALIKFIRYQIFDIDWYRRENLLRMKMIDHHHQLAIKSFRSFDTWKRNENVSNNRTWRSSNHEWLSLENYVEYKDIIKCQLLLMPFQSSACLVRERDGCK